MEEYNHRSVIHGVGHKAQSMARRRASSDARSIPRPLYPAMGTGPIRPGATFFEDSINSRIYGSSFNHARDHYHTNGNISVINFFDTSPSGIKDALDILRFDRPAPARLSRSNPTSEVNSPKLLPHSINDSAESSGGLFEGTPIANANHHQAQGNGQNPTEPPTTVRVNEIFEAYYWQLLIKQRGFPLYVPEPSDALPVKYQRRGIGIGDVGIFTDYGGFEYLFNVCVPKDDPINPISILHDFHPLNPHGPEDIREYSVFGSNDYLASSAMKIGSGSNPMTFVSTASEGAVLVLPNGSKSYDLPDLTAFMKYASANVEKWYKYAKETFGYPAKNGDLRLIVGHDTATAWGLMSFTNLHELEAFRFRFKEISKDQSTKCYRWEYLDNRRAEARSGPDIIDEIETSEDSDQTDGSGAFKNQCLFARTLNISFQQEVWGRLVAERIGGSDSTDSLQSFEEHPSKTINDLLLKARPDARIAITQDWNWISVIQTTDNVFPSHEVLFGRILEIYDICEDEDTVFLEAKPINKVMGPRNVLKQRLSDAYTSKVGISENHIDQETFRCEEMRTKEKDTARLEEGVRQKEEAIKRNDEEVRWAGEEARRAEEAIRKQRETIREERETIRKERQRLEQEKLCKAEEFRKKEQDVRMREMEAERTLEAAKKMEVEVREKAEEVKTKEADLKKKDEETRKREEKIKIETEKIRKLHIEEKKAAEEAKAKQNQLLQLEETKRKEDTRETPDPTLSSHHRSASYLSGQSTPPVPSIPPRYAATPMPPSLDGLSYQSTGSIPMVPPEPRCLSTPSPPKTMTRSTSEEKLGAHEIWLPTMQRDDHSHNPSVHSQTPGPTLSSHHHSASYFSGQSWPPVPSIPPRYAATPAPPSLGGLSYNSTAMVPPKPRRLTTPSPPKMMTRSTSEEKADAHERWHPTMQHDDDYILPRHSDTAAALEKERQKLMYGSTTASPSVGPPSRMGSLMSSFRR